MTKFFCCQVVCALVLVTMVSAVPVQPCPNQVLSEGGSAVAPFAASPIASGFGEPVGIAFDSQRNTFIADFKANCLYRFNAINGNIATNQNTANAAWKSCPGFQGSAAGLAFTSDGKLWLVTDGGYLYLVNPSNGQVTLAALPPPMYAGTYDLKVDPIKGDLFFAAANDVFRVTNWNTPTPTVSRYAFVPGSYGFNFDGIGFASDGTLYGRLGQNIISIPYNNPAGVQLVYVNLPTPDGIGVAADNTYLLVNDNNGHVYKIDLTVPLASRVAQSIFSGGSRGDTATVGPDGCFYITQSLSVVRLTTELDCTCKLTPALPPPATCPNCPQAFTVGTSCASASKHSSGRCATISFSDAVNVC